MTQHPPFITIIIPHHNSFNLLLRLLDSIPDDPTIELIVVDDNSNKDVIEQLNNYPFKQNVTIVYNKKNGYAGKARNIGLNQAKGKWIIFADADDFFAPDMYSILEPFLNSDADIIYFNTHSIYNETLKTAERHIRYKNLVKTYLIDKSKEDNLKYSFTPPWGKMYKRSLIQTNKIYFDEVIASNDIIFSIKTAAAAKKIEASNEVLYIISVTSGSLTNSFGKKYFDSRLNVALRANDFLVSIKKNKYQLSILYYLIRSYKFGVNYSLYVIRLLIKHRSNPFIGMSKVLKYKKYLKRRENREYLVNMSDEKN